MFSSLESPVFYKTSKIVFLFTIYSHDLLHLDTEGLIRDLQGVTRAYMGLQGVTRGYSGLQINFFITRKSLETFLSILHNNK